MSSAFFDDFFDYTAKLAVLDSSMAAHGNIMSFMDQEVTTLNEIEGYESLTANALTRVLSKKTYMEDSHSEKEELVTEIGNIHLLGI